MKKNVQWFIKVLNSICGIVGGVAFLGEFTFLLLRIKGFISNSTLIIGVIAFALCWWTVYAIKYFTERRLINQLKDWAQKVVDTNYYQEKKITVTRLGKIRFSGPTDMWFVRKFIAQSKKLFANTGLKIYYNGGWIWM